MKAAGLVVRAARWMVLIGVGAVAPARAQTSASYQLVESTINASGDPSNGIILVSPSFRIRLDSVGTPIVEIGPASASFQVDSGFAGSYPPPREINNLRFSDETTLEWDPEASAARYQVYRGALTSLPGNYGTCFAGNLTETTFPEALPLLPGRANFYLVTGRNLLWEEGPKGYSSSGALEPNPAPCP